MTFQLLVRQGLALHCCDSDEDSDFPQIVKDFPQLMNWMKRKQNKF